jgi:murein DD-endopeptidase MepM/ murein hydrolase activator NlpD
VQGAPGAGISRPGADGLVMRRIHVAVAGLVLGLLLALPAGASAARVSRPIASSLTVWPRTVTEGQTPSISLKIVQRGARKVRARIVVLSQPRQDPVARLDLGRVATGRRMTVPWPDGAALPAGRYLVRIHALDPHGRTLLRRAHSSGRLVLTVNPAPAPPPAPAPAGGLVPGVFPVAGPHVTWPAGSSGSFGVGRVGHLHQGHDIAAAAGTPVVAPVAGTVSAVRYQAGGAGWYVVLDGADGRDYFFAHCTAGSVVVAAGAPVAPGQQLCGVGMTGSATGPHLHFEIWMVGWRVPGGYPVDPLPQLLAWGG